MEKKHITATSALFLFLYNGKMQVVIPKDLISEEIVTRLLRGTISICLN